MIAIKITERRNIIPIEQLEEKTELGAIPPGRSPKYYMDMSTRKLPPTTVLLTDSEKDAAIRNRNEQSRLNNYLDHINMQEDVFCNMTKNNSIIMRQKSAQLDVRTKLLRRYSNMPDNDQTSRNINCYNTPETSSDMKRSKSAVALTQPDIKPREMKDNKQPCKGIMNRREWTKRSSSGNLGCPETILTAPPVDEKRQVPDSCDYESSDSTNLDDETKVEMPSSNLKLQIIDLKLEPGKEIDLKPAHGIYVKTGFTVRYLTPPQRNCTKSKRPSPQSIMKEVRLLNRKRRLSTTPKFDFSSALERQRTISSEADTKLNDFYQKLKDMKKKGISKWELKDLEERLKLW